MVSVRFVLASACIGAHGDSVDPFSSIWKSTWRNIVEPRELEVSGTIPTWLNGALVKNAGGAFETSKRNVTSAFDGIPKLFKFAVADGRVMYQERFLQTGYYQYVENKDNFPKVPLMTTPDPPFSAFSLPNGTAGDITNIQVWRMAGDDKMLALTDSTLVTSFDLESLETTGTLPVDDAVAEGLAQLAASHPQCDPSAAEPCSFILNFASVLLGAGGIIGQHELTVYRMGLDKVRRPFGSHTIDYAPYIHSFAVTKSKMILVAYPTEFSLMCVSMFKALTECMTCPADRMATIMVFDLASTEKSTKPVVIQAPNHMVMHHVNAYEEDSGDIVYQVSAHDECDPLFHGPTGQHGVLTVMKDPTARDLVAHWGKLRTFRIAMSSTPSVSYVDTVLRDQEGFVYDFDFPYINDNYAATKHRFVWAITPYAQNSTRYEDWAVTKVDLEAEGAVNTKVWFKEGHFPCEPVFVARPGGATEDDGVLLLPVTDGVQERGYLLILDAISMAELATATLSAGEHLPYTQHGKWFDAAADLALAV